MTLDRNGFVVRHKRMRAKQRLRWLRKFWKAEKEAGYPRGRWAIAQEIVDRVKKKNRDAPISVKSMQRWEMQYWKDGLAGLVDRNGRPPKR